MSAGVRPGRPGAVERFLRLFTDVRAGEGPTALLLTLNVFLILLAYYIMRPVRTALILAQGGAEVASYAAAGQALLLLGAVPLYGSLASRLPRRPLINVVTAFFVACLGGFYLLALRNVPIGVAFYLWIGVFNLMVVAQFWSFANDVYTTVEGKRLFPIVGFGASSGAVAGAWLAGRLAEPLGVYELLLLAAALLVIAALITNVVDARERRRTEAALPAMRTTAELPAATAEYRAVTGELRPESGELLKASGALPRVRPGRGEETAGAAPVSRGGAFRLVFRSRYLLLIALLIVLLNWVNTTGGYLLNRTVEEAAERAVAAAGLALDSAGGREYFEQFVARFDAGFLVGQNLVGLVLQLFFVSRILKYLGVRVALLWLPVIAFAGYALIAFYPLLGAIRWVKTAENGSDYSVQKTVSNVLFLPTTREEKYKAKQAIDGFFWRMGDLLSAGLVFVGTELLVLATGQFAVVNMALVAVWLVIAVFVGRRYERLAAATGETA